MPTPRSLPRCAFALAGLAGLLGAAAAAQELVDGIAAQVGSDVVLASEVTTITRPMEARLQEAGAPPSEIARVRAQVLDRLVERRLIEQLVRRVEIDASELEVDAAIAQIAEANGITLDELVASVEAQGLDYASYREEIRAEIQRTKVLNGVIGAQIRVEDATLLKLYDERYGSQPKGGEQVHIRHIIVSFGGDQRDDVAAARTQAEAALARVRAGESFVSVAREVSDVSPETGGDVGWVHVEALAAWMAPTVNALEPGQTSEPLRTGFGYNLLHLVDRRQFRRPDFEEVRGALYEEVYSQPLEVQYEEWIERLRSQTFIEKKGIFAEAKRQPVDPDAGSAASGSGSP